MTDPKCHTCEGCGFIADDDDHTPWATLEKFHQDNPGTDLAIRMGLVKKLACPKCNAEEEIEPDLKGIASRIALIYGHLEKAAALAQEILTVEELDQFDQYIAHQDAVGFIFDPTTYRDMLHKGAFEKAKLRTIRIRDLLKFELVDKP